MVATQLIRDADLDVDVDDRDRFEPMFDSGSAKLQYTFRF
jgi:hypothetical protein